MGRAKQGKKLVEAERQRMLLIEEPESFLHPPMIRAARDALYDLASIAEWQVLACTHSPIFIDVSKPHTTILRIEKKTTGAPRAFQTEAVGFSEDERTQLRMIRSCHPTVSEFFFADHVFLVEGETEAAVLTYFLDSNPPANGDWYHVVNCMGKGNLALFARILNHFGTPYTLVHDSDAPMVQREGKWIRNGMWTVNKQLVDVIASRAEELPKCGLVVHIPGFEEYYFGEKLSSDKPYNAMKMLKSNEFQQSAKYAQMSSFAADAVHGNHPGYYSDYKDFIELFTGWCEVAQPQPLEQWIINEDA